MKRISLLLAFFLLSSVCPAATIVVDVNRGGDFTAIKPAVEAAASGDTVLVYDGVYKGSENRDISISAGMASKAITISSQNGPEVTIIDCENSGDGFILPEENIDGARITGFTITNSRNPCVFIPNSRRNKVILKNTNLIRNNSGVHLVGGNVELDQCNINNSGFGVDCTSGKLTLRNCTISENSGNGVSCRYIGGFITMSDSTISHNSGHGVFCLDFVEFKLDNCNILNNGGLGLVSLEGPFGYLSRCTIQSNAGGGINVSYINPIITNCNISQNGGYLIQSFMGGAKLVNCTVTKNYGNGIKGESNSIINFINSIYWENSSEFLLDKQSTINFNYSCIQGVWPGEGNIDADPLFRDPERGDYRLRFRSPAIDAGTAAGAPATDLDGGRRPCGGGIDMGAYELCAALDVPDVYAAECRVEVPVYLETTEEVRGLSFGISHDPSVLYLKEIKQGAACGICPCLNFIPDVDAASAQGEAGGTLGVIHDLGCTVPPGRHEVARFVYLGKVQGSTPLELRDSLGNPPVLLEVTTKNGSVVPNVQSGSLQVPYSCYMVGRGDVEANGKFSITDVIWSLLCLFDMERDKCPSCLDVADVNDDGSFDIGDPVYLIDYLFRGGPSPLPPFPGCGFDLTDDSLPGCVGILCNG